MCEKSWYVVYTKPCKETQVSEYFLSHSFGVFYPTIRVKPADPRSACVRPYFPRYLFLNVDLEEVGISSIQWAPGVVGLVQFGGQPATVPDHIVRCLEQRVQEIQARYKSDSQFSPGDSVCIVDGPFAGYEGIFDTRLGGGQRIQILLEMLGRLTKTQVDISAIVKKQSS